MTKQTITRRYTTEQDMPDFDGYLPAYSTWDLTLSATTVTSRVVRFAVYDPNDDEREYDDDDDDEYEDEDPRKLLSTKKAVVTCADVETALRRFGRRVATRLPRVAEWTEAGYVVRGPKLVPAKNRDMTDKVWVRAGALVEEPLGEASARALARFAALSKEEPTERVRREACALLAAHCDRWMSGLLPYATLRFSGGVLDSVELGPNEYYVASTRAAELEAFFDLPIAKTVRRFVLGEVGPVAMSGNTYCNLVPLVKALFAKERPSLEEFALGVTADGEGHNDVGDLSLLWRRLPNLTSLTTGAHIAVDLSDASSSRLRRLSLSAGMDQAEQLVYGAFPSLESLELSLVGTRELAPLWSPAGMPKLTRLDLVIDHDDYGTPLLPTLVAQLADSAVIRQLAHLSLSIRMGDRHWKLRHAVLGGDAAALSRITSLTGPTLDAIQGHAAAFSRLASLRLGEFFVTPERAAELTACLPHLSFSPPTLPWAWTWASAP